MVPLLLSAQWPTSAVDLALTHRVGGHGADFKNNAFNRHFENIVALAPRPLPSIAVLLDGAHATLELGCGEGLALVDVLNTLERYQKKHGNEQQPSPCVVGINALEHVFIATFHSSQKLMDEEAARGSIVAGNTSRAAFLEAAQRSRMPMSQGTPHIVHGDFRKPLPLPNASVDFIYSQNAVSKLKFPNGELEPILTNVLRLLAPNGSAVLDLVPGIGYSQWLSAGLHGYAGLPLTLRINVTLPKDPEGRISPDLGQKAESAGSGWASFAQALQHKPLEALVGSTEHIYTWTKAETDACGTRTAPPEDLAGGAGGPGQCVFAYIYGMPERGFVTTDKRGLDPGRLNMLLHRFEQTNSSCAESLTHLAAFQPLLKALGGLFHRESHQGLRAGLEKRAAGYRNLCAKIREGAVNEFDLRLNVNTTDAKQKKLRAAYPVLITEMFVVAARSWLRDTLSSVETWRHVTRPATNSPMSKTLN